MKEITLDEALKMFDPDIHGAIRRIAERPEATHLVVFENTLLDSSSRGAKTAVLVGPENTFKSLDDVRGKHLGDLPSQRQYPQSFVDLAKLRAVA